VVAVVLGGSHAAGTADEESDTDLGLYYQPEEPLDLISLREVVTVLDDHGRGEAVTGIGEWGPWVNGGAWIEIEGHRVDLIYRDIDRVRLAIEDCRAGRIETHFQVGHPAGFSNQIYAAEIHLCRPLLDHRNTVAGLKELTWPYPEALRRALIDRLWEARFLSEAATSSARRGDVFAVAGSVFRSVACMVQALFGLNQRYWINEKASVSLADGLEHRPHAFARRVEGILGELGTESEQLEQRLYELNQLWDETDALCHEDVRN
jgi:hypothetical protein